ncbi:hypothetical protein KP509_04G006600 [Ceratopteris richardii]|uniref:Uncharacterized protein n=1 Tax=Ceratopteris richardii TaxID=49495 RepID=A0A8T2UPW5_CERRI|nr:hypothetical protein KP509_04G006600 [Ceratopteris richardii]
MGEPTHCDKPLSPYDIVLLAAGVLAVVPFVIANIVILVHRKRRFFRAQGGAPLILTSSVAGLIWIIAEFVVNGHFYRSGLLRQCSLWTFWLQLTMGFCLWIVCQITRVLQLVRICGSNDSTYLSKRGVFGIAILIWTPGLCCTIAAHVSNASSLRKDGDCRNCAIVHAWKYCLYIIFPVGYFTILLALLHYARRIDDYMMNIEYSHASEYSLIMPFVIYLTYGATILSQSEKKIAGRCFLTFCICFIVFINFWVRLGWAVYLCLFKSKGEMDDFEMELQSSGAQCLNRLNPPGSRQESTRRSYSLDWLMKVIVVARSEASECKEKINQLRQRKLLLSEKYQADAICNSPGECERRV